MQTLAHNPGDIVGKLNKYCGLGVTYLTQTPLGVQVTLMRSSLETPAQRLGMQDGDILHSAYRHGEWHLFQNMNDYFDLLGGIEGSNLSFRIIRGVDLPKHEDFRGISGGKIEKPDWEAVLSNSQMIELHTKRERIYPGLPANFPRNRLGEIPFQSLERLLNCVPMSRLELQEVDMAESGKLAINLSRTPTPHDRQPS